MNDRHHLVRIARKRNGLTGQDVAQMVRTFSSTIYAMESGKRAIGDEMLRRYLDAGLITRDEAIDALVGPSDDTAAAS